MSIQSTIGILNMYKLERVKKKPSILLFKKELAPSQRKGFVLAILSYFIFLPLLIALLIVQSRAFELSMFNIFFVTLLVLLSTQALCTYIENLQHKYRIALYKSAYDPDDVEEVFALFGAVLTRIRTFEKHKHTQENLFEHINGKLKLMGERKTKGIFSEMNKFFEKRFQQNQ